jgi:hypothetical protein
MRRLFLAGIASLSVILPAVLRLAQGLPLFPGTQPYIILSVFERILPRATATLLLFGLIIAVVALMAITAMRVFRLASFASSAAEAASLLLVASPIVVSALQEPIVALELFLLFSGLALVRRSVFEQACGVSLLSIFVALLASEWTPPQFSLALADFGAPHGYGLFLLLAALVGASVLWKNKKEYYFTALGILALVVASFFVPPLLSLGSVAVAAVAGLGIIQLRKRHWHIPLLRPLSITLFLCGVLFSTIASMSIVVRDAPSATLAEDLAALQLPEGAVLTAPENRALVQYWADGKAVSLPDETVDAIWHSRDFDETRSLLHGYDIRSIVITDEMRERIWLDDEDGLLFLLGASKIFKRLPSGPSVEAWAVAPDTQ